MSVAAQKPRHLDHSENGRFGTKLNDFKHFRTMTQNVCYRKKCIVEAKMNDGNDFRVFTNNEIDFDRWLFYEAQDYLMRQINNADPKTITEIARCTGLSNRRVSRLLDALDLRGYLAELKTAARREKG